MGFVYLIESDMGLYKIGTTTRLESRLSTLRTASPCELKLLHSFEHENASAVEKELHGRFASKRVRGEWFRLDYEDVEYIVCFDEPAPLVPPTWEEQQLNAVAVAEYQDDLIDELTFDSWFASLPWGAA